MEQHDKRLPDLLAVAGEESIPEDRVLTIQQVGAVVLTFGIAEHDPFADDLYGHFKEYPQDAP